MSDDPYASIVNDPLVALMMVDSIFDDERKKAQARNQWLSAVQQQPAESERLQEVETPYGPNYITIESALRAGRWTVPMPETQNYEHQAMTTLGKALERLWGRKALRGGGF